MEAGTFSAGAPPFSLVAGIPAKVIKTLDESNLDNIHAQAVKYKDLWSKRHNIMPDIDGEQFCEADDDEDAED